MMKVSFIGEKTMCHDINGYNISKSFISTWLKTEQVEVGNAVMSQINTIFDDCDTQDANGKELKGGDTFLNKNERNLFLQTIDTIINNLRENSDEDTDDSNMAANELSFIQENLKKMHYFIKRFEDGIANADDFKKMTNLELQMRKEKELNNFQTKNDSILKEDIKKKIPKWQGAE